MEQSDCVVVCEWSYFVDLITKVSSIHKEEILNIFHRIEWFVVKCLGNVAREVSAEGYLTYTYIAVMIAGLIEVKVKEGRRGQPWFTKEIAELRRPGIGQRRNG